MFVQDNVSIVSALTMVWSLSRNSVVEHVPSVSALQFHMAREGIRAHNGKGESECQCQGREVTRRLTHGR